MKKEATRMIKTTVAGIAILAAVICYNVEWNGRSELTEFQLTSEAGEQSRDNRTEEEPETPDTAAESAEARTEPVDARREPGAKPGSIPGADSGENGFGDQSDNGISAGAADTGRIFIHVCGEVQNPGVYEMEEGSRIYQAVAMAGGFSNNAAESFLNMAQTLKDGMKIQVPNLEEAGRWTAGEAVSYSAVSAPTGGELIDGAGISAWPNEMGTAKVNLNTATKEQLMILKGIGEARAEAIISYRQEFGPFGGIEDIMEVSGIKDAAFQKIKDDITV